ncbi:MutS protein msh5 [Apophysomyces ossiformis]|uniref:MutS protein msh5 n=1 Tax=Apophysomyces ossiformis TaxID=679940 RepID=A0A8H7ESL2_9FUNG|nr:MutS protein msh5 [Apophysomyces ossiformis]
MIREVCGYLKQMRNIPRILSKVREHQCSVVEWQQLLQFAYYGIKLYESVRSYNKLDVPIVHKIQNTVDVQSLKKLGSDINDMIDFERSHEEDRTVVKKNVDEFEVAQEIASGMQSEAAAALNVVYFPQLGYLLALPRNVGKPVIDSVQLFSHFKLQFTTAEYVYFKNDQTKELDETMGDIHVLIVVKLCVNVTDKEIELLQGLAERTLTYKETLLNAADVFAELDSLISLAVVAKRCHYVKPEMTANNVLHIVKGRQVGTLVSEVFRADLFHNNGALRHPIYELNVDVFVPNDTHLVGGQGSELNKSACSSSEQGWVGNNFPSEDSFNSIMLLSGANCSGKSVYLKQTALITYMAHIGSFVPASEAIIGITDKMFVHAETVDTVSAVTSAFAFDLQQLLHAITYATERSMIIVDEFGKGTDSADGAGLLYGVVNYLLSLGSQCPRAIFSSHFHEIFSQHIQRQLTHESEKQASETSMLCSERATEEMVFLYRIIPGTGLDASFGAWCASTAGLSTELVRRALHMSERFADGQPIQPLWTEDEELKFEQLFDLAKKFIKLPISTDPTNMKQLRLLMQTTADLIARQ